MSEQEVRESTPHQSEFDGGSFTIDFLADTPSGFEFKTRNSLRRRQGKYPPGTPLPISDEQIEKVKAGMIREVATAKKKAGIAGAKPSEITPEQRTSYMDAFRASQKVGLRNVAEQGNVLSADTVFVPFPFWRNINKPEESVESLEMANFVATALILRTADNKLVVQHRSTANTLYRDIPGASVAGQFDKPKGTPVRHGTLPEITTDSIKENVIKEMEEEIGLLPQDIHDVRITGLATDKVAIHNEFLLFANAKLTAEEIERKAGENAARQNKGEYDFDEKFFVIKGDSDSIRKLLTEVKCPLPSTHTAAFVAAWYSQLLGQTTPEEAKLELKTLEEGIKRNYQEIDLIVHASHPEMRGFDPEKTPQDQGLPDILSELKRTGLVEEKDQGKEAEQMVQNAWMFDVDGVLNNPENKTNIKQEIVDQLAKRLEAGEPVVFVTGRASDWFVKWILTPLEQRISDKKMLAHFFLSAEFGNVSVFFENGELKKQVDGKNAVPQDITSEARRVTESEFSGIMSVNDAQTFFSTEIKDGVAFDRFKPRKNR